MGRILEPSMRCLVVNAFGSDKAGQTEFGATMGAVRKALEGYDDCLVDVRKLDELQGFVHSQGSDSGKLSGKAVEIARELFDEFDPDGGGEIDADELVPLLLKLLKFLGSEVDPMRFQRLEWEAKKLLIEFDEDGSGALDFDEFQEMLKQPPWIYMLPPEDVTDTVTVLAMKAFLAFDVIVIDGDPNLMAWHPKAYHLLHLVWQVMYTKAWAAPDAPVLFGTALVAQMVQSLGCCERRRWGGYSVSNLLEVEPVARTTSQISKMGPIAGLRHVLCKDDDQGRCLCYDRKAGKWKDSLTVGVIRRVNIAGTGQEVKKFKEPDPRGVGLSVECVPQHLQHYLFKGLPTCFIVPPDRNRNWQISELHGNDLMTTLASCTTGPCLFEYHSRVFVSTFHLSVFSASSVSLLRNLFAHKMRQFADAPEGKQRLLHWMCTSGDNHALELVNPKSVDPRRPLELVDRTAEEALHVISPIAAAELRASAPRCLKAHNIHGGSESKSGPAIRQNVLIEKRQIIDVCTDQMYAKPPDKIMRSTPRRRPEIVRVRDVTKLQNGSIHQRSFNSSFRKFETMKAKPSPPAEPYKCLFPSPHIARAAISHQTNESQWIGGALTFTTPDMHLAKETGANAGSSKCQTHRMRQLPHKKEPYMTEWDVEAQIIIKNRERWIAGPMRYTEGGCAPTTPRAPKRGLQMSSGPACPALLRCTNRFGATHGKNTPARTRSPRMSTGGLTARF